MNGIGRIFTLCIGLCSAWSMINAGGGESFVGGLAGGTLGGIFGSSIANANQSRSSSNDGYGSSYSAVDQMRYELERQNRLIQDLSARVDAGSNAQLKRRVQLLEDQVKEHEDVTNSLDIVTREVEAAKRDIAQIKRTLNSDVMLRLERIENSLDLDNSMLTNSDDSEDEIVTPRRKKRARKMAQLKIGATESDTLENDIKNNEDSKPEASKNLPAESVSQ